MSYVPTQCDRILAVLSEHHGEWVEMPALAAASGAYAVHSRVSDLRADGHVIETRVTGVRPRKSSYRLVSPVQEVMPL